MISYYYYLRIETSLIVRGGSEHVSNIIFFFECFNVVYLYSYMEERMGFRKRSQD